uniref:Uncharacterized protein n=1 Tax=Panagrolaimus davidi TaxID=227884 RepID=A0A914P515_9BILA
MITISLAATNESNPINNIDDLIECPCPIGIKDECIKQPICVYGINDNGVIFFNGKNDSLNLTNIALQRKAEINNTDDVLVNLYNPEIISMVIFYYGCQRCDDLKEIGNFTVPQLRKFLLSLYNQRMKYNIKYAQSDFVYVSDSINVQQPMPEIEVRPFWKNRLMLNQSCARKQLGFTQKHFIPAFLTQDFCILDYKSVNYLSINETYQTSNGEIIYSPTLSYIDLYSYNILPNSSYDIPADNVSGEHEACKMTLNLESDIQTMRFFCVCPTHSCTLKVTQKDPLHCCPYSMNIPFYANETYSHLEQTSDYMSVDEFFLQSKDSYCFFRWYVYGNVYVPYIDRVQSFLPNGYFFDTTYSSVTWNCPYWIYKKEHIEPIYITFYKNDTKELRDIFLKTTIDHSQIAGNMPSIGANCSFEGALSHPTYSASFGTTSEMFPCYKYYDLYSLLPVVPMMGINTIPVTIHAKGEYCYYYTVKLHRNHMLACNIPEIPPIMTILGCPENVNYDLKEVERMRYVVNSCPTMKSNETQWKYETKVNYPATLCGQFLRGLKLENGRYVPEETELRQVYLEDFEMIGTHVFFHGCGFNASQKLTICTCPSSLGNCDNLYTVGRC